MRNPRLYAPFCSKSGEVELSVDQQHYIKNVLRLREGAGLRVFNEREGEYSATLAIYGAVREECFKAILEKQIRSPQCRAKSSWLAFSPIKPHLVHWIIEKATELDVTHIQPLVMERTQQRSFSPKKWQCVARDAAQQCERLDIPHIQPLRFLPDFLRDLPSVTWFVAMERLSALQQTTVRSSKGSWGVIVGPEGGFTEQERQMLVQRVHPLSLGPNVLRSETAALCAAYHLSRVDSF